VAASWSQEDAPRTNSLGEAEYQVANRSNCAVPNQSGVPELKGCQKRSRVLELEQGVRIRAGSQNWSNESELEQGARTRAGRRNWSRVTRGGAAGLQETAILSTNKQREDNYVTGNEIISYA